MISVVPPRRCVHRNLIQPCNQRRTLPLGYLQLVGCGWGDLVAELRVQHLKLLAGHVQGLSDILQTHLFGDRHPLIRQGRIKVFQIKAEPIRVVDDMESREKPRDITGCFPGKLFIKIPKVVQILNVLGTDNPQDPGLPTVVCCQHGTPVSEYPVKLLKVGNRRQGRLMRIHPLVYPLVPCQTKLITCRWNELPQPQRASPRQDLDIKTTFDQREPRKLLWNACLR